MVQPIVIVTILVQILTFGGCLAEQSQLISHQPIRALACNDVILPCHLELPMDASSETVKWTRPDLDPKYVSVYFQGQQVYERQNLSYYNRTTIFPDELKNGNISMKISRVKPSDTGKYFCFLDPMMKEASIQLTVGVVSTPVIEFVSNQNREVVLQYEAKGWYPEPEVFWLDAEGNLLSAGPTETVRGPDDLYTVSRRLTVRKSDNFTCRVQQKNIKQTRETHFYVPDDFFTVQFTLNQTDIIIIIISSIITLVLLLVIVLTVKYFRTKRRLRTVTQNSKKVDKNTKTIQTNGSHSPMLHKQDEQLDIKDEVVHIDHQ